ncbi:MAG: hypothetical protein DRQ04_07660, partial [Candidatus Hydrothermota bacterium]
FLEDAAKEARSREETILLRPSDERIVRANELYRVMAAMPEASGRLDAGAGIKDVEVVRRDMGNTAAAISYIDEEERLVIFINSNDGRDKDFLEDTEAMARLIREEFVESKGFLSHRQLKELELKENKGDAMTLTNSILIKHMSFDQLKNIEKEHELDPDGKFHAAVQMEKCLRVIRDVAEIARPAPYAVLMPMPNIKEKAVRENMARGTERMFKERGIDLKISYYDPYAADGKDSAAGTVAKVLSEDGFGDTRSRVLVYAPADIPQDILKGLKGRMENEDRFSGIVRQEGGAFDEDLHVALAVGLMDYSKTRRDDIARSVIEILKMISENPAEIDDINLMDLLAGLRPIRAKEVEEDVNQKRLNWEYVMRAL